MNAFPYWQGAKIEDAPQVFRDAVAITKSKTKGKPFIVGETGWPTDGPNFEDATTSVGNLKSYWSTIGCELRSQQVPNFWFSGCMFFFFFSLYKPHSYQKRGRLTHVI